jgi:pyridoxine/pyridoxamine 5'-phosphate oxidase
MDRTQQALLQRIWGALQDATTRRTPFTLGYLATVDANNAPRCRAVILRRFAPDGGAVTFLTNTMSAKVQEIRANPIVALTVNDDTAAVQLRMEGHAEIIEDLYERRRAWESFGPQTQDLFRSPLAPGTPLGDSPGPDAVAADAGQRDENAEFERFAWVKVHLERLDWLDISSSEHERCQFLREGNTWAGEWIVP